MTGRRTHPRLAGRHHRRRRPAPAAWWLFSLAFAPDDGTELHAGALAVRGDRPAPRRRARGVLAVVPGHHHRGRLGLPVGQRARRCCWPPSCCWRRGSSRSSSRSRSSATACRWSRSAASRSSILGGADPAGRPVEDGDLPRRAGGLLHHRRRGAARLQGGRPGQPRRRPRLRRRPVHPAAQGAAGRGAARDPQRAADRGADRVPRRGARRVHGRHRPQRRHPADPAAGQPRLRAGLGGLPAVRAGRAGRLRRARAGRPPGHAVGLREGSHEPRPDRGVAAGTPPRAHADFGKSIGRSLLNAVITIVIVLALWQAVISFTDVSPYVAKGPVDVWNFLFVDDPDARSTAAEHRAAALGPDRSRRCRTRRSASSSA